MTNDIKKTKYRKSFVAKSYQSWDKNDNFNRNDTFFIFKNNAYQSRFQKNSNRYDSRNDASRKKRSTRMKVTTKIKSKSKDQDFKRTSKNQNYRKFWDKRRYDKERFDKNKTKVYTANEHIEKTDESDELENYHHSKNMTYFKSKKNDNTNSKDIFANIFVTLNVICRICKAFFVSNNALHKHFRNARCNIHHKADFFNIDVNHVNIKESVSEHKSINQLKSTFQIAKLAIVSFKIDFKKNIEIEYEFRNWQYVIAQLNLTENASNTSKCIDSEIEITLANTQFFKAQIKNFVSIQTMITFITIRNLKANRHFSNKYVIVSMYFKSKNVHENAVRAMITREVHLIDELKINILIDNDIFDSKLFDISMFNKSTYIKSCEITISITIISHRYQTKLIHCIKIELISSHTEKLISIHKIFLAN